MKSTRMIDARVRKTRGRLRDALVSLIHERSYDSIVVNHILRRADVGRSAFYAHFENKDALLASGIEHILEATPPRESATNLGPFSGAVSFSFPFFQYVGQCRNATALTTRKRGRAVVHGHLRQLLVARLHQQFAAIAGPLTTDSLRLPPALLAEHVAGTFVLVLNWWVDTESPLSPEEVDDVFLSLVRPALAVSRRG